ncbi:MAG: helix-turn-helix transcriptional regulator [Pseudomonadota bacterium]
MDEFASTALYNLIVKKLSDIGVDARPNPAFQGKTQGSEKADLLSLALSEKGCAAVFGIGQGIRALTAEPIIATLLKARSPFELLARWQRLERYFHGSHRVRVVEEGQSALVLEHYSLRGGPPSAGEDLLIVGLLTALLQCGGARGLTARIGTEPAMQGDQRVEGFPLPSDTARWQLCWERYDPRSRAVSTETPSVSTLARLTTLLSDDLGHSWRLSAVAQRLGVSTRSLQRALSREGASFQKVLRTVRVERSAALMASGCASLIEVGYVCGFADQAHFSRDFKLRFNMTPSQYLEVSASP